MARIYGLNGALRGRQGNNVFSVQNGTQVVKAYQPVVSNPRTDAQKSQRSRFALAGKISAATPSVAIMGLRGANKRSRRGDFVSRIVANASTTTSGSVISSSIRFADIIFSEGQVARYSPVVSATATRNARVINVTFPQMVVDSDAPAGYGELVLCGIFDTESSPLDVIQVKLHSADADTAFAFRQPERLACAVAVWVVPFVAQSSVAGLSAGNLGLSPSGDAIFVASDETVYSANAIFGLSELANVIPVAS